MAHCDDTLRKIGTAIAAWQREHEGQNPAALEDLVGVNGMTVWDLVCPAGHYTAGECAYVYRGADLTAEADEKLIIAYDKDAVHKDRRNVLFADGHVERYPEPVLERYLKRDNALRAELGLAEKK